MTDGAEMKKAMALLEILCLFSLEFDELNRLLKSYSTSNKEKM